MIRTAAEKGLAQAQRNLGICYLNGEGVKEDKAQAKEWLKKAEAQGDTIAAGICQDNGFTIIMPGGKKQDN